jgi:hypothetical protein
MSVTIGSQTTLPNPLATEAALDPPQLAGGSWVMASGRKRAHVIAIRKRWRYGWIVTGTNLTNLLSGIAELNAAEGNFVPCDDATTYTAWIDPGNVTVTPMGRGSAYRHVQIVVDEMTA